MLLRYSKVRLEAQVLSGKYAICQIAFSAGGNLILTDDNTQGKSTVVNALAVGLGFDDLVKSNVAALVKDAIKIEGVENRITDASIWLEIANEKGEYLTIRRSVKPELSKGMMVRRGLLSEWGEAGIEEYYLGSGSYTDTKGFHRLLSEFIGFPEIEVISQDDSAMRLYLEYIFSAIFIEQKRGWADIMANAPYYRVRDPKKSTIAEILGMDYIRNNLQRNALRVEVERLKAKYDSGLDLLRRYVNAKHFSLKGLPQDTTESLWNPRVFRALQGQEDRLLDDLINGKKAELTSKQVPVSPKEADPNLQNRIEEISKKITTLISRKNELDSSISTVSANIRRYEQRMVTLSSDLEKNKEELRIRKLFNRDTWSVKEACPVCEQAVNGTLLSQLSSFPTMSIDDNVKYIAEQKSLLQDVLAVEIASRDQSKIESQLLSAEVASALAQHSEIQRSLSGGIPSELMAQAREIARLEQEIATYEELFDYTNEAFSRLNEVYEEYVSRYNRLSSLRSDLSPSDKELLRGFQEIFKNYLGRLGFDSFEINSMIIDETSFSPRVIINSLDQRKKVRADFGSSASDWIRIITAFALALHASRTNSIKSNHPNVSIFDEPAQQNINRQDYLKFFDLVADVCSKGGQVIVAATDKDHAVREKAKNLGMNVIDFGSNYILQ